VLRLISSGGAAAWLPWFSTTLDTVCLIHTRGLHPGLATFSIHNSMTLSQDIPMFIRTFSGILVFSAATVVCAQTTVLNGVYSNIQAQRGAKHYNNICANCHEGGEPDADPLFGAEFIDRWREAPLAFLYGFISTNMPGDDAGNLSEATYVESIAFLLKENGYPAGSANLTATGMADILLVGQEGPQPLPPNSLVRVAGCLEVEGDMVRLTQAAPVTRVRTADETTPEELAISLNAPAGTALHTLNNTAKFAAATLAGQKVQAKGVLAAQDGVSATINTLSLTTTGASCG
jgi:cbb3-type cytochrome c oxidase subunit III